MLLNGLCVLSLLQVEVDTARCDILLKCLKNFKLALVCAFVGIELCLPELPADVVCTSIPQLVLLNPMLVLCLCLYEACVRRIASRLCLSIGGPCILLCSSPVRTLGGVNLEAPKLGSCVASLCRGCSFRWCTGGALSDGAMLYSQLNSIFVSSASAYYYQDPALRVAFTWSPGHRLPCSCPVHVLAHLNLLNLRSLHVSTKFACARWPSVRLYLILYSFVGCYHSPHLCSCGPNAASLLRHHPFPFRPADDPAQPYRGSGCAAPAPSSSRYGDESAGDTFTFNASSQMSMCSLHCCAQSSLRSLHRLL